MNKSRSVSSHSRPIDAHSPSGNVAEVVSHTIADIPEEARLYRLPQVLAIIPMSRAKFLKLVHDGEAPPPIKCGRSSFWLASEIKRYLQAQIEATRATNPFDMSALVARITNAED